MSKFAKKTAEAAPAKKSGKGGLVINLDGDKPSLHVKGAEETKVSRKAAQAKADKADTKAPKAAKEKATKVAKEVKEPKAADSRKIKLLVKENPKREGSASYDRFELYRTSKTVADFVAAGGTTADVRYDEKAGFISVA